jgi:hypothetical protein
MRFLGSVRSSLSLGRVFGYMFTVFFLAVASHAQTPDPRPPGPPPDPARPALTPLPQLDDWSFLKDASKRTDMFDPIKYIALGHDNSHPRQQAGTMVATI